MGAEDEGYWPFGLYTQVYCLSRTSVFFSVIRVDSLFYRLAPIKLYIKSQ